MAASDATVKEVLAVVVRYVDREMLRKIVRDLLEVPGNRSFRDTIVKMARELGLDV